MHSDYHVPAPSNPHFARTNLQTISQRAEIMRELLPGVQSIGELCGGDCAEQWRAYTQDLGIRDYLALDITPEIVAHNRKAGIDCICGDVLDPEVLRRFLGHEVLFYGPPLSVECDGHRLLTFAEVTPSYAALTGLLLGELGYEGTLVCICPKSTTMGEIRWLYQQIQAARSDVGLSLIHHSYSTVTGRGEETEPRKKYVELWFSSRLADTWAVRESS